MSKIIGIDLGTTNSCVSVVEGNNAVIIPNSEGQRTTPSAVAFTRERGRFIGDSAKRQAATNPSNTFLSVKRDMGTSKKYETINGNITPQEISAMILQKLKGEAENYLGQNVTEAVITVPAYFNDAQRQATKDAGKIAGLNVKRIINEPTAAALAYGVKASANEKIMVYDFGGGTLDVSIIETGNNVIEVISTSGNNHLGGDDIDRMLADWIIGQFYKKEGIDLQNNKTAYFRILEAARKAKENLSFSLSDEINLPFIAQNNGTTVHLYMTVTRNTLEKILDKIKDSLLNPIKTSVKDARIFFQDIDRIILVGGSTRIPYIRDIIYRLCNMKPEKTVNPDECVAMGAAIQGENLNRNSHNNALLLLDVTPLTLSVKLSDGTCKPIVRKNQTIPTSFRDSFTTSDDYQDNLWIQIYQGERLMADDNFFVGEAVISGILPAPKGVPDIEIIFSIDENGIIGISATEKKTNKKIKAVIKTRSLSEHEMNRAIMEAQRYAEEDKVNSEKAKAANRLESLASTIAQNSRKFDFDREESEKLECVLRRAKDTARDYMHYTIGELEDCYDVLEKDANECYATFYSKHSINGKNTDYSSEEEDFYKTF